MGSALRPQVPVSDVTVVRTALVSTWFCSNRCARQGGATFIDDGATQLGKGDLVSPQDRGRLQQRDQTGSNERRHRSMASTTIFFTPADTEARDVVSCCVARISSVGGAGM